MLTGHKRDRGLSHTTRKLDPEHPMAYQIQIKGQRDSCVVRLVSWPDHHAGSQRRDAARPFQ